MKLSNHAKIRSQQRSIPPLIIDWLEEYGATTYDHHGGLKRYFDKSSRKMISKRYGKCIVDRMGDLMNAYIIEGDNTIVTVGHRRKRLYRN